MIAGDRIVATCTPAHVPSNAARRRLLFNALRLALFAVALVALRREIAGVDGARVLRTLQSYGFLRVVLALLCAAASFVLLGAMEVLAVRAVGGDAAHRMPRRAAFATAFVAHAFSNSVGFGPLTGGAVRLRTYARHGVDALAVARITATVMAAVILALVALGALALAGSPSAMRHDRFAAAGSRAGIVLTAIAVCVAVIIVLVRRTTSERARSALSLPPLRIATLLTALAMVDWLITGTVFVAFAPVTSSASLVSIVSAFTLAHAAGMASQVPGGAGVLEATLLSLLSPGVPLHMRGALAASLVAYRLTYYLVPLCVAAVFALAWEARRAHMPNAELTIARTLSFHTPSAAHSARPHHATSPDAGPAHRLEWLIDNADAYDCLLDTIRSARRSVWVAQLAFDADCIVYSRDASPSRDTVLAETLTALAATHTVDVRILLNENTLQNTLRAFRRYLRDASSNIRVRGVRRFPHFLHVKLAIVDGRDAFLLGSPFVNGYWDDARHPPTDARRPNRELSGRPLHDVSVRVGGHAVRHLESLFADLWNDAAAAEPGAAADGPLRLTHAPSRETRGDAVRVVRTLPRRVMPNAPLGATEVLEALVDGLAGARSLIYIEHQYLTSRPAVDALVQALARERDLEVVIVVNQNPDLTAYRGWQNARLAESGLLAHPRVGIFTLWSVAPSGRPDVATINQVFVHSKVVTIDDQWALVGAANLDGLSLHSYGDDFTGRAARRIFRHVRNFEVSLVVRDGDGTVGAATDLRTKLWSEHLGASLSAVAQRPAGGWLTLWRIHAKENVRTLGADAGRTLPHMRGFILPYSTRATPVCQLADVGVRVDRTRLHVQFDPGWLEVHLSAGWVRNIFA